ncbi:MAG: isopentenyl-diphosphate delta-isomerase [Patiriisocius sp.]|jgi:isopentenyl-diphosphate delta-isomerase
MENVVLVDEQDKQLGLMEKMEAHEKGLLHRAFSVFIFDESGNMLLQQRAESKYHSPKLWTNACCSHPRDGETVLEAATRRLQEEMGFVCDIEKSFDFIYKAELDQGLTEHEFDHVLIGKYEGKIARNPDEVMEYKYVPMDELLMDVDKNAENYTVWFKVALPTLIEKLGWV